MNKKKEAQTSSKFARVFKSAFNLGVKVLTFYIPQGVAAKIGAALVVQVVESLVKNSKSPYDDKALETVKKYWKK